MKCDDKPGLIFSKNGNISVAAAMFFCLMMMVAAFAIESSNLYLMKLQTQRASDIANLAAAGTPQPLTGMAASAAAIATASELATLNGMGSARVTTEGRATVADGVAATALVTTISRSVPLQLGKMLQASRNVEVDGQSWALVRGQQVSDCILSMIAYTNIYGKAVVKGPRCTLKAASYLFVCNNAAISLLAVAAGYPAILEKLLICDNIPPMTPPLSSFTYDAKVPDPLAADPRILAIQQRLATMRSGGWPYGHVSPRAPLSIFPPLGPDQVFGPVPVNVAKSAQLGSISTSPVGVVIKFAGSGGPDPACAKPTTFSGTVKLSGVTRLKLASGCYVFGGDVNTDPSSDVALEIAPGAVVKLVINGALLHAGNLLVIGDASVSIAGNIDNASGRTLRFGNGDLVAGAGLINGSGDLSFGTGPFYFAGGSILNGEGSMSFGNGAFYLWGGSMTNAFKGRMTFGNGPFVFYGGTVTNDGGKMSFGKGPFEFFGGGLILNANSETRFGAGDIDMYGGSIAFAGKSVALGVDGSAIDGGSSVVLAGGSLTLSAGQLTATGTTIALDFGAVSLWGDSRVQATAPTGKTPAYGYQDILIASLWGSLNLNSSQTLPNIMSGTIYVPKGFVAVHGKHWAKPAAGGCLQIYAGFIDIYEDSSVELSPCTGSASSVKNVALVR